MTELKRITEIRNVWWWVVPASSFQQGQNHMERGQMIAGTISIASSWAWQNRCEGVPTFIIPIEPF